jgi:hypothetical protein
MQIESITLHTPRLVEGQWACAAEFVVDGMTGQVMLRADEPLVRHLHDLAARATPYLLGGKNVSPRVGLFGVDIPIVDDVIEAGGDVLEATGDMFQSAGGVAAAAAGLAGAMGMGQGLGMLGGALGIEGADSPLLDLPGVMGMGAKALAHIPGEAWKNPEHLANALYKSGKEIVETADKLTATPAFQAVLIAAHAFPPTAPFAEGYDAVQAVRELIKAAANNDPEALLKLAEIALSSELGSEAAKALGGLINEQVDIGMLLATSKTDFAAFLKAL